MEKGEEEEEEEEEDIRTTMQSSIAMQQSCTCWPRQLFLSSKVEKGERRRRISELQCSLP